MTRETEFHPTAMKVNLQALKKNYVLLKEHVSPSKVMAVLKANAYGHGLIPCAQALEQIDADYFGVAFLEEGKVLRCAGIKTPILVFGGILGAQIEEFLNYELDLTASSVSKIRTINKVAGSLSKKARIHLKIDTGLERIGVHHYGAETLIEEARSCNHCEVVGIFSHFATADEENLTFAEEQLKRFQEVICIAEERFSHSLIRHMANSAAVLQIPESYFDMVRSGVILYGVSPTRHLRDVVPVESVMSLSSRVVYFKVVKEGSAVGYGQTWKASKDTRIVTVPVGYGDGYLRRLSNCGEVLIRGRRYPVVGNVFMDQVTVDIGEGEAYNEDEVVLVGRQGGEEILVEDIAEKCGTVPHEVLATLNLRVPRVYL